MRLQIWSVADLLRGDSSFINRDFLRGLMRGLGSFLAQSFVSLFAFDVVANFVIKGHVILHPLAEAFERRLFFMKNHRQ